MARDHSTIFSSRYLCYGVFILSLCSIISLLNWCQCNVLHQRSMDRKESKQLNLLTYPSSWNHLTFSSSPPAKLLKVALFVRKWPQRSHAGGLERHAMTLHLALAQRGHDIHIFTTSSNSTFLQYPLRNLHFYFSKSTPAGYLDQATVWNQFQTQNSSGRPFDVVHTESVGLRYTRARNISNLVVSWHGIAYETIHSDIIQELLRTPDEPQIKSLTERLIKVVDEVKFFPSYAHHVATSDHCGDILKRVYMIPQGRVHIILNGVDQEIFKPDISKAKEFKTKFGIPESKSLVMGMAGRLVKDKGHPLIFEALKQLFAENKTFRERSIVLVAGDGPWASRYRDLGTQVIVLGPLDQVQLSGFYNAIDIFVNPTLRAQGLDHTLLEAMLSGKPVMATRLASIQGSVVVSSEMGYVFSPTVVSLKKAMNQVWLDGREVLNIKGQVALNRGLQLFTANKMAAAYERLFLCIASGSSESSFCQY